MINKKIYYNNTLKCVLKHNFVHYYFDNNYNCEGCASTRGGSRVRWYSGTQLMGHVHSFLLPRVGPWLLY